VSNLGLGVGGVHKFAVGQAGSGLESFVVG